MRNIPRTVAGVTDSDITLVIQSVKSRGITTATSATCNWVTQLLTRLFAAALVQGQRSFQKNILFVNDKVLFLHNGPAPCQSRSSGDRVD